jgi:hypothetical protein
VYREREVDYRGRTRTFKVQIMSLSTIPHCYPCEKKKKEKGGGRETTESEEKREGR